VDKGLSLAVEESVAWFLCFLLPGELHAGLNLSPNLFPSCLLATRKVLARHFPTRDFCDAGNRAQITHTPRGPWEKDGTERCSCQGFKDVLHNCVSCCQMPLVFFAPFVAHFCSACCPICWFAKKKKKKDSKWYVRVKQIKQMKFKLGRHKGN